MKIRRFNISGLVSMLLPLCLECLRLVSGSRARFFIWRMVDFFFFFFLSLKEKGKK